MYYVTKSINNRILKLNKIYKEKSIPMTALWCPAFGNHGFWKSSKVSSVVVILNSFRVYNSRKENHIDAQQSLSERSRRDLLKEGQKGHMAIIVFMI